MSWLRLQSHSDIGHKFVWLWVSHREPFAKKQTPALPQSRQGRIEPESMQGVSPDTFPLCASLECDILVCVSGEASSTQGYAMGVALTNG